MLLRPVQAGGIFRLPAPLAMLWLALAAGCTQPACTTAPLAELRLFDEPTGLYAPVTIDGHKLKLLLDTGSTHSLLTSQTARRLGLPIERLLDDTDVLTGFAIEGLGGRRHVDRAWPHSIALGRARLLGTPLSVVWSQDTFWDPSLDGILGMDILSRYDLDLDVGRSRLALSAPGAMCPPPQDRHAWSMILPADPAYAGPRLPARLDGERFDALIDTGAQQSSIMSRAASRLGRGKAAGTPITMHGVGPSEEHATQHRFDTLSAGGIVLRHVPIAVVNAPGLSGLEIVLGTDFLAHARLWLFARDHRLSLAGSPAPVAP